MSGSKTTAFAVLVVLACGLAACHGGGGGDGDGSDAVATASVQVAPPLASRIIDTVTAYGTAVPAPDRLAVVSSATGGKVEAVLTQVGDRVTAGQLLVRLAADPAVQAGLQKAKTAVDVAGQELHREQRLVAAGVAAGVQLETARAAYATALADLHGAQRAVSLSQANTDLTAPLAGVVTSASVSAGMAVAPQTPVVTVADLGTLWFEVGVAPSALDRIAVGQTATLTVPSLSDHPFEGRVVSVGGGVGADTQKAMVRIAVANPSGVLQPGMFGKATIDTGSHLGLTVPADAVIDQAGRTVVYVASGDMAVQRVVTTASAGDPALPGRVEVLSGVTRGDRVVVKGVYGLSDGAPIQVQGR